MEVEGKDSGRLFLAVCGLWFLHCVTYAGRPPAALTAEADLQRMTQMLGIQMLRQGRDPDQKSIHPANFDEEKVARFELPPLLVMSGGQPVTSARQWYSQRRPELVELFAREIYGRVPPGLPNVKWRVETTSHETRGAVRVVANTLRGRVDNSAYPQLTVNIEATEVLPANSVRPIPMIVTLTFDNFPASSVEQARRERLQWQERILEHGWGYVEYVPTSVQADNGAGLTGGIIGLANKGQPRKLDDWGALRAWAWGASRVLDYLRIDRRVDGRRVGIEGLSRFGKAALVAMAYDERFAIGFIGSSGAGGAKLWRRNFGEQLENITSPAEYHWMAGNFLKYAGPLTVADLPVDQHELIALCAPRPVFISVGSPSVEGGWVDAKGMFLAAMAAGPAYELLSHKPLPVTTMPPMETAVLDGDIAFRQHSGGHTTTPNWPAFIEFADRYFKRERM